MTAKGPQAEATAKHKVDVVCFGMLSHLCSLFTDTVPQHNAGSRITGTNEYFGDDASIIAAVLHDWGLPTGLICTAVGNDDAGHKVAKLISELGIPAEVRMFDHISTELEMAVSDPTGARTYWQQRNPKVLDTLATADLSMLSGAKMLYVDWYDGDNIQRAMKEAVHQGVPVYLNIESRYDDTDMMRRLAPLTTICQVSMDEPGVGADVEAAEIAEQLLASGISTSVITRGSRGCLVSSNGEVVEVSTPGLKVVDGSGAGAFFAAGFIFAHLQGWPLGKCASFATAAASLKCSRIGFTGFDVAEIKRLAASLNSG